MRFIKWSVRPVVAGLMAIAVTAASASYAEIEWRADFSEESCYLWTTVIDEEQRLIVNINFLRFKEGDSTNATAIALRKEGVKPGELVLLASPVSAGADTTHSEVAAINRRQPQRLEVNGSTPLFFLAEPESTKTLDQIESGESLVVTAALATGSPITMTQAASKPGLRIRRAQLNACWKIVGA